MKTDGSRQSALGRYERISAPVEAVGQPAKKGARTRDRYSGKLGH